MLEGRRLERGAFRMGRVRAGWNVLRSAFASAVGPRGEATGDGAAKVTVRLRQGDDRAMATPGFRLYSIPRGIASHPAA